MNDLEETAAERASRERAERIATARAELARRYAADPGAVARFEARKANLARAAKRERARFDQLVIGMPAPKAKKKGRKAVAPPPYDARTAGVRARWAHKNEGTPETHEHASRTHQGALAQLHANGTIDNEQLEWAAQIANVHRSIESDVAVAIASLEARVDNSGSGRNLHEESLRRIRLHAAYTYWRSLLPAPKRLVLDMIVGEPIGFTIAARRYRVHNRKAKRLLLEALDRWPECVARAYRQVGEDARLCA